MKILTEPDFLISKWSGGTTTQLYIFPEDADLAKRNFDWRISSAVVENETSGFTLFEGYERILIPLKGRLEMEHQTPNGVFHQDVAEFQLARFSGSWETKGKGKLTDFNLIFRSVYHPKVHIAYFTEATHSEWEETTTALFLQEGACSVSDRYVHAPALILNDTHQRTTIRCSAGSRFISIEMDLMD